MTATGSLYHWTSRGWELFSGGLHQRPMEFKDAAEAREYLAGVKIKWPTDTIDMYISDPSTNNSFLSSHEIRPFDAQ
jgi:hypothetical protein